MPSWPVALELPADSESSVRAAAMYTAAELPAVGEAIVVGGDLTVVTGIEERAEGDYVIFATGLDE